MQTAIISSDHPQAIGRAARVLQAGGLVAFPTDTVYGVGADASQPQAVLRLYEAKGRQLSKAIPLLLAQTADVEIVAEPVVPLARRLAARFWPGPLTLVLWASSAVLREVTAGGGSVALRVPRHPVARALIAALGGPLAASSANLSGRPSPVTTQEVWEQLEGRVDLILDGGRCPGGMPSTVLDLTVDPPQVLRPGPIGQEALHFFSERAGASGEEALCVAVASDHAGYELKARIAEWLADRGYGVRDLGTTSGDVSVDYPDMARLAAEMVASGECQRGIVICGTGIGVSMAANKVAGVRAALCTDAYMARMSRQHNDANVLCLGQRVVGSGLALDIVAAWLEAVFEGGRHARRVDRIEV